MTADVEYYLVVRTDKYTGNWDSFLTGLLFGVDDDRYGCEIGKLEHRAGCLIQLRPHPDAAHDHPYTPDFENNSDDLVFALEGPLLPEDKRYLNASYAEKGFAFADEVIFIKGFAYRTVSITRTEKEEAF